MTNITKQYKNAREELFREFDLEDYMHIVHYICDFTDYN